MMRISLCVPLLVLAGVADQGGFGQDLSPGPGDVLDAVPAPDDSGLKTGRAYLGVGLSSLGFDLTIVEVERDGPAESAGLEAGDRIVSVDGRDVRGFHQLAFSISRKKPGDSMLVGILRGHERLDIEVTLGGRAAGPRIVEPRDVAGNRAFLGVGYGEVPPVLAVHLGLDFGSGVLVGAVHPQSAAKRAGIVTYDVIVRIDGELVRGRRGLVRLIGQRHPGESVTLDLIHRGKPAKKTVVLDERPRNLPRLPPRLDDPSRRSSDLRPRGSWRGRLRIGPDSVFEFPWEAFDPSPDGAPEALWDWLDDRGFDEQVRRHVREALEDFDSTTYLKSGSTVRVVDGDLDITVSSEEGETFVTVRRSGKTIGKDLPLDQLDTLPEDAREAVRAIIETYEDRLIDSPPRVPGLDGIEAGDPVNI